MRFFHRIARQVIPVFLACMFLGVALPVMAASTVVVKPNTVINSSRKYSDVILDMTSGSFLIKNGATLTVENSQVTGTLSDDSPVLFNIENGRLNFKNNRVSVRTPSLPPHPLTQSLQYVMLLGMGTVNLNGNEFIIDESFTAGLLITTASTPTTGIQIVKNSFQGFHGVLYLINSDNALVADNILSKNSFGNIVLTGNNGKIIHNTIAFSGNNHLGNSMDIFNSDGVEISRNLLLTPTCHGIYVLNSQHMKIAYNRIMGGITYAMNILTYPETAKIDPYLKTLMESASRSRAAVPSVSSDIAIYNNYMGQNRFGIAASNVKGLTVNYNYFVQRFQDAAARKFWTDNEILLQDVSKLVWSNNFYKEAFTQEADGNNNSAFQFVPFPATGGVVLQ